MPFPIVEAGVQSKVMEARMLGSEYIYTHSYPSMWLLLYDIGKWGK